MRNTKNKKLCENNRVLIKEIEKYINVYLKDASIEELADLLGYSSVYTGRLVKKLFGASFKSLLQDARLSLSAKMLRTTKKKIGEIISECGYENESFFRRIFKKEFGVTPLAYRKQHSKE